MGSNAVLHRDSHHQSLCLCRFPDLFRELDRRKEELQISGYGITETTLEEVFLAATRPQNLADGNQKGMMEGDIALAVDADGASVQDWGDVQDESNSDYVGDRRRPERLTVSLFCLYMKSQVFQIDTMNLTCQTNVMHTDGFLRSSYHSHCQAEREQSV